MRTYIGWLLDSKTYTNREDVPRSEEPDLVDGAVMIRYDNVNKHKAITSKIELEKITQVIEIDTRVAVKVHDRVYTENGWLKVESVDMYLPKEKESIVKLWPARRTALEVKRLYLA